MTDQEFAEKLNASRMMGELDCALVDLLDAVSDAIYVTDSQLYREDITAVLNDAHRSVMKARELLNQDLLA